MSSISNDTSEISDNDDYMSSSEDDTESVSSTDSSSSTSSEIDVGGPVVISRPIKKSIEDKKNHQNGMERKRRDEITHSFKVLKKTYGFKTGVRATLLRKVAEDIKKRNKLIKKEKETFNELKQKYEKERRSKGVEKNQQS